MRFLACLRFSWPVTKTTQSWRRSVCDQLMLISRPQGAFSAAQLCAQLPWLVSGSRTALSYSVGPSAQYGEVFSCVIESCLERRRMAPFGGARCRTAPYGAVCAACWVPHSEVRRPRRTAPSAVLAGAVAISWCHTVPHGAVCGTPWCCTREISRCHTAPHGAVCGALS